MPTGLYIFGEWWYIGDLIIAVIVAVWTALCLSVLIIKLKEQS